MTAKWTTLQLGECCTKIGSGATPRGGAAVYEQTGRVSLIRSQNVYNDRFLREGLVFIREEHADQLAGVTVKPGDVLLNITGDSVARCNRAPEDVTPARVNQHVAIIRPDPSILDAGFLHYWLVRPATQEHMLGIASAGGTRNALTKGIIEGLRLEAPPVEEQRAIAHVLGALDDKIEANRELNGTLEATCQALFRSWFVDFDPVVAKSEGRKPPHLSPEVAALFPSRLQESENGPIPEGWSFGKLGDLLVLSYGKSLPERIRVPGKIPVYGSNGAVGFHSELLVRGPGIVVGRKGSAGCVTWAHTDYFPIDTTFYVESRGLPLTYHWYQLQRLDLESFAGDSAVPGLNRELTYLLEVVIPPSALASRFHAIAEPMFDQMRHNDDESHTLAALRDALLPRLLSGELRVREAEELTEEAV